MRVSQGYDTLRRIWQRQRFALFGLGLLVVCLIFVSSVQSFTSSNSDKVTLSFVIPNDVAPKWQPVIDEFEATHPNIEINLVNLLRDQDAIKPQDSKGVKEQYINSFKPKENPLYDLVFMDIIWVPEFAEKGWIRELPMKRTDPELKKFLINDVDGGTYKGKLYRMPFFSDIGWLYYRTDLLENAGLKPPETFQELINISQHLQKQGRVRWGYLWQGRQAEALSAMFLEVLHGYGGFWIDPKTSEVGLGRKEAIAAVEFLRNTMFGESPISPKELTAYREDETRDLFIRGDAAFLRNWPYVLTQANLPDSKIRNKIDIIPMVHAPGHTSGSCQGGWGLGIANKTQYPNEAWEAVKFFSSAPAQRKLFLAGIDGLPTRKELFTDPQLVKRYSHYPATLEFLENENQKLHPQVVLRPVIPRYDQATCILQKYLHTALTQENSDTRKEMLKAAQETRRLLKNPNEDCTAAIDREQKSRAS